MSARSRLSTIHWIVSCLRPRRSPSAALTLPLAALGSRAVRNSRAAALSLASLLCLPFLRLASSRTAGARLRHVASQALRAIRLGNGSMDHLQSADKTKDHAMHGLLFCWIPAATYSPRTVRSRRSASSLKRLPRTPLLTVPPPRFIPHSGRSAPSCRKSSAARNPARERKSK
jgi:hypothetical protein